MTDFPTSLAFDPDAGEQLIDRAKSVIAESGIVRVTGFPPDAGRYVAFLSSFGEPLMYYGGEAGTHPDHRAIWRIKYDMEEAQRGDTHAIDGPLPPHSSQSMRALRPPYFSMLMVDSGWQDAPPGNNGESVFVRWAQVLKEMKASLGAAYEPMIGTLLTEVPYPGDQGAWPVLYRLPSPGSEFDLGVRLKSNLLEHLQSTASSHPATAAVQCLCACADSEAQRVQLSSGDLVLLDNDRWGHGRESITGHVMRGGVAVLNPRELWSVTVG